MRASGPSSRNEDADDHPVHHGITHEIGIKLGRQSPGERRDGDDEDRHAHQVLGRVTHRDAFAEGGLKRTVSI
jgi:hypothetical protein